MYVAPFISTTPGCDADGDELGLDHTRLRCFRGPGILDR